jgi:hypothetical protein
VKDVIASIVANNVLLGILYLQGIKGKMSRETVFLSHANPEDNIFAGWLAAKLSLEGYRVWCDLRSLVGGEDDFWGEIEKVIRNETAKFIFITSHESIVKRGTKRELALADGVRGVNNFVIPISAQDIDYRTELPAEISRSLLIDFRVSWAIGLSSLLKKLVEDSIPRAETSPLSSASRFWQEGQQIIASTVTTERERHWTNWFPLELPESIYVVKDIPGFPIKNQTVVHSGFRYSFSPFPQEPSVSLFGSKDTESKVTTQMITSGMHFESNNHSISVFAAKKALVQLCNCLIERGLQKKGLMVYPRATGSNIYYVNHSSKVPMKLYKRLYRNLCGNYNGTEWHYGVSIATVLTPIPHVVIKNHVIFTKNKQVLDNSRQISARRHVCRMWFNDRWRDLLLALMLSLSDDQKATEPKISIDTDADEKLFISAMPIPCYSSIGYIEPVRYGASINELD